MDIRLSRIVKHTYEVYLAYSCSSRLTPQKNSRLERIHSDHSAWLKKKKEIQSVEALS